MTLGDDSKKVTRCALQLLPVDRKLLERALYVCSQSLQQAPVLGLQARGGVPPTVPGVVCVITSTLQKRWHVPSETAARSLCLRSFALWEARGHVTRTLRPTLVRNRGLPTTMWVSWDVASLVPVELGVDGSPSRQPDCSLLRGPEPGPSSQAPRLLTLRNCER